MEDTENKDFETSEKAVYSKEEFDKFKAQLEAEFAEKEKKLKAESEEQAKKSTMTELERALAELEEFKKKYKEKEDECLISKQKEETLSLLKDANLDSKILDVVYTPLDMEKTKTKIEIFKNYIEEIKKGVFQNNLNTPLPLASGKTASFDAFVEGFDTNRL